MRHANGRIVLSAILSVTLVLLALPVAASDEVAGFDAWQGQGNGQGRGNGNGNGNAGRGHDDRGNGQGNQGRGNDDRGNGQGNPGRGQGNAGRGQGNQGRGNDDRGNAQGSQGRGNGNGNGRGNSGNDEGRGAGHGRHDRPDVVRLRAQVDRLPENVRRMATSSRRGDRIIAGALARASLRGVSNDRFRVESDGSRWSVKNDRNDVLLDMDDDDARELGHWQMRRLGDRRANDNAPAFCRSGAGHPVWGREWCLEKGFGLGVTQRTIWSRARVDDVRWTKRPTTNVLDRGSLIDVLGDVVFGRLAVQSLLLGYDEPLAGRWVASSDEPDAPFVLMVSAGDFAVAELVDTDRDDDVDVLFVSQPRW